MSYEQMILTVVDNGLSSQRIHFQSTKQLKGHPTTERSSSEWQQRLMTRDIKFF